MFTVVALCVGVFLILNTRELVSNQSIVENRNPSELKGGTAGNNSRADDVSQRQPPVTALIWNVGWNSQTLYLIGGIALIGWSLGGGWISGVAFRPHDPDFPTDDRSGVVTRVERPDGSELYIECFGRPDGIPIILTHGWGLDSREWIFARRELANRCRVIVWDLPELPIHRCRVSAPIIVAGAATAPQFGGQVALKSAMPCWGASASMPG